MDARSSQDWKKLVVSPEFVLGKFRPGMSIFLSTGVAEPRTMVRHLMNARIRNLEDLELIQLVSFGDAISQRSLQYQNFRLKTFFSGWVADTAIREGRVDLIPTRFVNTPHLIASGQIPVDAAIVQVTPPDRNDFCSLGVAVDIAREAMEQAEISVAEINPRVPRTRGDTIVRLDEFDYLVSSTEPPVYFPRWAVGSVMTRVAKNVAVLIEDESCLAFSIGPLYEALAPFLKKKKHLGIHSPFFTDPLMDLMRNGTVTNRRKESYRGQTLTSYAFGTPELMRWLNKNPLVEFQRIDKVFNPKIIGRNPKFVTVIAARKIDLYGRIGLHVGKGYVATGPAEIMDFFHGAELSRGGRSIFALTSRDHKGRSNVLPSIAAEPNQFSLFESVETIVTEYGMAYLAGRTVRERAQALIDIAHPDDRRILVEAAKQRNMLYSDQIFVFECAKLYPDEISECHTFGHNIQVRFRPIRPSDEEGMRHLFYRFSEASVYSRYFQTVTSMPHAKIQEYVNVDWTRGMSIVGLVGDVGKGCIIAEARYLVIPQSLKAEIVFFVDDQFQRHGIAGYLYEMLIRLARERGIQAFTAEVLSYNTAAMAVIRKGRLPVQTSLKNGTYHLDIPLDNTGEPVETG